MPRFSPEKRPSKIPVLNNGNQQPPRTPAPKESLPPRTPHTSRRVPKSTPVFLTKEALTPIPAWDTKGRLQDMELMYVQLRNQFEGSKSTLEESIHIHKQQADDYAQLNKELKSANKNLTSDLDRTRAELHTIASDLKLLRRDYERDLQEAERRRASEVAEVERKWEREVHNVTRERERDADRFEREMDAAKQEFQKQRDALVSQLTAEHAAEIRDIRVLLEGEKEALQKEISELQSAGESRASESATEVQELRNTILRLQQANELANASAASLRARLVESEQLNARLEQEKSSLISKTHFLEGNQEAQSQKFTSMRQRLEEAESIKESTLETLRKEEALRRKLNATILELRGNIRVFARTRPLLPGESEASKIEYPDSDALDGNKEMVVHAPTTLSATGKSRNEKHAYTFDHVFGPQSNNTEVFENCRDLIQSVVDGYNVTILSYGQTGSGKTYGMSGPHGIIPSSIDLLLNEMVRLRLKGWEYEVSASFAEVYNETLNDLLGDARTWQDDDKKKEKHEIKHDPITGRTTVTGLTTILLWPPKNPPSEDGKGDEEYTQTAISSLLETANKNRRVAATKANERSSRSHSIFMLTLKGTCDASEERSEGVLNLVDLAGSERLKQSGAEGTRAKETAAINKSLSALGDVIASLAARRGEEHVPYRNSKLTYLLQSSLGGTTNGKSSRTLMLLHLSPLQAHWNESRSSLVFGTKVNGTCIKESAAKKR
ncbi:kinesin-domain-containing protein [Piedraia hortae CBS 480.64]|uniref:Kinesin-like protein n=1 Tax=Piedraia hortae CBS 480.64 TaxID=1314780 RepID=A0A6A7C9N9_9PEZI|nr:kinesin-domain-containing protein [Piedraia hortae CBS 480.64]